MGVGVGEPLGEPSCPVCVRAQDLTAYRTVSTWVRESACLNYDPHSTLSPRVVLGKPLCPLAFPQPC